MDDNFSQATLYYSVEEFPGLQFEKCDYLETSTEETRDVRIKHFEATFTSNDSEDKKQSKADLWTKKLGIQQLGGLKVCKDKQFQKKWQRCNNQSKRSEVTSQKYSQKDLSPPSLKSKISYISQSNWLNHAQLRCILDLDRKKIKTICRIKDAEIQFQNGELNFRLSKIVKMKVLYEDYQKCLCFSYDQTRGKRLSQLKFKIYIEYDLKEQLFTLFSKIVIQKLLLLGCRIDLNEKEQKNVDKLTMAGELYKQSQYRHSWNIRKLVLTDRIESFKGQKCTFQMKNIKEMWTRFEIFEKCLVLKLRHAVGKTALAIPIVYYPVKYSKNNWLYRIYRLLTSAS